MICKLCIKAIVAYTNRDMSSLDCGLSTR